MIEGDVLFKGRYLRLPGVREIDKETYPTYVYQKIDEGVLKRYTRYRLCGFVGSSRGLEIYTIRHQTNRMIKNVPNGSRSAEVHEFSLLIDIGEVDYNENIGV